MGALVIGGLLSVAVAAQPVVYRDLPGASVGGDPAEQARSLLRQHEERLGLSAEDLEVRRVRHWRDRAIVHLDQLHEGVVVQGAGAVLRLGPSGELDLLTTSWQPRLAVSGEPTIPAAQARERALNAVGEGRVRRAELRVRALGPAGRLVWQVELVGQPLGWWQVELDAHSGELLGVRDLRAHAQGRVYLRNLDPADLGEAELTGLSADATALGSSDVAVSSIVFEEGVQTEAQLAVVEPGADFLFDPEEQEEDPFAEVNAYHHISEAVDYFRAVHGHVFPGRTTALTSYRDSADGVYDNAFFQFSFEGHYLLTFGEGSVYDFAHDPDVVVHEFSHGVVDEVLPLLGLVGYPVHLDAFGMHPGPGGLVEGMPDYFASTLHDDPEMATSLSGPGPMRDLDNDLSCPADIFGEAHEDGRIAGGAAWDLREIVGAEVADVIVYGTLGSLSGAPTFEEFSTVLLESTEVLVGDGLVSSAQLEEVEAALEQRGMLDCGRSVPSEGEPVEQVWFGADLIDYSFCDFFEIFGIQLAPPFQVSASAPAGAEVTGLEIDVQLEPELADFSDEDLDWRVFVKRGEMVEYEVEALDLGGGLAFDIPQGGLVYDLEIEAEGDSVQLSLGPEDLQLEGGETYYVGLLGANCRTATAITTVELVYEPVDTGGPADTGDSVDSEAPKPTDSASPADSGQKPAGGCGCDGGAGGAGLALWWLGLAALRRQSRSDKAVEGSAAGGCGGS